MHVGLMGSRKNQVKRSGYGPDSAAIVAMHATIFD